MCGGAWRRTRRQAVVRILSITGISAIGDLWLAVVKDKASRGSRP
jgi:hypothetical protein